MHSRLASNIAEDDTELLIFWPPSLARSRAFWIRSVREKQAVTQVAVLLPTVYRYVAIPSFPAFHDDVCTTQVIITLLPLLNIYFVF